MARVLGFLIRYFSNYYTLHRSDLAAKAAPLHPRLISFALTCETYFGNLLKYVKTSILEKSIFSILGSNFIKNLMTFKIPSRILIRIK